MCSPQCRCILSKRRSQLILLKNAHARGKHGKRTSSGLRCFAGRGFESAGRDPMENPIAFLKDLRHEKAVFRIRSVIRKKHGEGSGIAGLTAAGRKENRLIQFEKKVFSAHFTG